MPSDLILFGAFERHNFGDVLMGHVFEKILAKKDINVTHASILNNDLTAYSGTTVHSIFDLVEDGLDERTPILHVGGETASCPFVSALNFDSPLSLPSYQQSMISEEVHRHLTTNRKLPYITPPEEVINGRRMNWKNRLFYGIGFTHLGSNPGGNHDLREAFEECRIAGFRDSYSLENASIVGIRNTALTPDIVCYINRLMPIAINKAPRYVLLHFSKKFLEDNRDTLISQLATVSRTTDIAFIVGIAGVAYHHDSLDALYRFKALAAQQSLSIDLLTSLDALDICRQIARASLVISTSLHYRIVARAYGVPRISFNTHKVNCWANANDKLYPFGIESETLASTVSHLLTNPNPTDSSSQEKDADMIENYLERITEIVKSAKCVSGGATVIPKPPLRLPQAPSQDLWIASMACCLDNQQATINKQNDIIKQHRIYLASKRHLVKQLLTLMLPTSLIRFLLKTPLRGQAK